MLGNLYQPDKSKKDNKNKDSKKPILTTLDLENYQESKSNNNYTSSRQKVSKNQELSLFKGKRLPRQAVLDNSIDREGGPDVQDSLRDQDGFYTQDGEYEQPANDNMLTTSDAQMKFEIEKSEVKQVVKLKENFRRWENIVEVLPYWRSAVNPINVTLSVITVLVTAVIIYINIQNLPNQVPLFYSQVTSSREVVDKSIYAIIPIFVAGVEFLLIKFKRMTFDFDRRLSTVLASTQIFFNLMFMVALLQIVSLMLI